MEALLSSFSASSKGKGFLILLMAIAAIGGVFAFPLSYLTNSNELIGLCLLPFVLTVQKGRRFSYVFFLLFVLFGWFAWIYAVRMFYFFSLAFYMLWLIELLWGTVNLLTVFLLGFMSPFFFQVSVILGFPIRLKLSEMAGTLLKWTGVNVQVEGNMMVLNGATFTVDEACMGLNMLAISMLMGVFIIAYTSRTSGKSLNMKCLILFFLTGLVLNIGANLFRIILLVLFKIAPENPMHDVIGLLCLVAYILIPLYILGRWTVLKYGHESIVNASNLTIKPFFKYLLVLLAFSLTYVGIHIDQKRSQPILSYPEVNASGFTVTQLEDGVTKLVNDSMLIYVKPISEFFSGEHTPLICWKGSGYTFKNTMKTKVSEQEIYFGQLVKDQEILYTAWWYENGTIQTINQLDWRIRMMRGENRFALINVTSDDENLLKQRIQSLLHSGIIQNTD